MLWLAKYSSLPNKRPGRLSLMVLFFPLKGQLLILDFYQRVFFQTGTFIRSYPFNISWNFWKYWILKTPFSKVCLKLNPAYKKPYIKKHKLKWPKITLEEDLFIFPLIPKKSVWLVLIRHSYEWYLGIFL